MSEATTKRCYVCGEVKPLDEFHRSFKARDGRTSRCVPCDRAYAAARYAATHPGHVPGRSRAERGTSTPESRKAYAKSYAEAHPEVNARAVRAYRDRHPGRKAAQAAALRAAHPERQSAYDAKTYAAHPGVYLAKRARARGALVVEQFTIEELCVHLQSIGVDPDLCLYCKAAPRQEWDHVLPIALGGPHVITNVVPACRSCNRRKKNSLPDPAIAALIQGSPK